VRGAQTTEAEMKNKFDSVAAGRGTILATAQVERSADRRVIRADGGTMVIQICG
jgi:hypothetical protein